jgi:hypothetical protein
MKIVKTEIYSRGYNTRPGTTNYSRHNVDTDEIAKWMRSIAKIESFNIVEMPIFKKEATAHFMDIGSLKDGDEVAFYEVQPHAGLLRKWVPLTSKRFQNTSHVSRISCLSESSLQKSIMKYKVRKRVGKDGEKALIKFYKRYVKMCGDGFSFVGSKEGKLELFLYEQYGINLPEDYTLEDVKYEMDKANLFKGLYEESYRGYTHAEEKNRIVYQTT